jgi:hypothetical protein
MKCKNATVKAGRFLTINGFSSFSPNFCLGEGSVKHASLLSQHVTWKIFYSFGPWSSARRRWRQLPRCFVIGETVRMRTDAERNISRIQRSTRQLFIFVKKFNWCKFKIMSALRTSLFLIWHFDRGVCSIKLFTSVINSVSNYRAFLAVSHLSPSLIFVGKGQGLEPTLTVEAL